jgi:hypothetical protein
MSPEAQDGGVAAEQASSAGPQLRQDQLVDRLAPTPGAHSPSVTLAGFVGEGGQSGFWRLYLNPELSEYVEFAERDVVHTQPIPQEQSPLGGTQVWLRSDAPLRHIRISSRQVQADFLQGGITTGFLAGTASSLRNVLPRAATGAACTRNYVCSTNPHIPACQADSDNCGSALCGPGTGTFCPSQPFVAGCTGSPVCSFGGAC